MALNNSNIFSTNNTYKYYLSSGQDGSEKVRIFNKLHGPQNQSSFHYAMSPLTSYLYMLL